MRAALCLSGHVRNFEQNVESIKTYIFPYFDSVDVFCHLWDTRGWRIEGNQIWAGEDSFKGFDYYTNLIDINRVVSLIDPKCIAVEKYTNIEHYVVNKSVPYKTRLRVPFDRPENTVSLSYKINECNKLKSEYEKINNFKYDVVIRSRPDIYITGDIFGTIKDMNLDVLYTPHAESYGIASDIFAFSSSENMDIYAKLHDELDTIFAEGCLMNGHNIYKHHFDKFLSGKWVMENLAVTLNRNQI